LLRRYYSEGTVVKQGTLLFKIDPAPYQAGPNKVKGILEQEEAQLEKASVMKERLRPYSLKTPSAGRTCWSHVGRVEWRFVQWRIRYLRRD
jgi:multidrug efflux pump subunit AcrA (membrane-fusion protein)